MTQPPVSWVQVPKTTAKFHLPLRNHKTYLSIKTVSEFCCEAISCRDVCLSPEIKWNCRELVWCCSIKNKILYVWKTQQQCVFPEFMTQPLKIIDRTTVTSPVGFRRARTKLRLGGPEMDKEVELKQAEFEVITAKKFRLIHASLIAGLPLTEFSTHQGILKFLSSCRIFSFSPHLLSVSSWT